MKYLNLLFFVLFSASLSAQFTKPSSDLLDKKEGKIIASFSDSIKIAIGPQESGWYKTSLKMYVSKSAVTGDSTLLAGTDLLDEDKQVLGSTKEDIKVEYIQAEGRGFYKYYQVLIKGYMKSYSIEYKSIPEKGIEAIVGQKSIPKQREDLAAYFKKMDFIENESNGYTAWVYLDEAASLGEAHYRTIVVYRGETALYCIISRNEHLNIEKIKDTRESYTGNYFFFQRAQDKNVEEMEQIAYSFIPL